MGRIKVEGLLLCVPISLVQTEAHTKVQRQPVRNVPVVLEVRLKEFVAVVILDQMVLLAKAGNISQQEVREWIARAPRVDASLGGKRRGVKAQVTRIGAIRQLAAKLVLLGCGNIGAKLQDVLAQNFIYVVAEGVSWVGIVDAIRNVARVFSEVAIHAWCCRI